MATLGAELGCGRHLASTVVTGSGQRSSTLLAELCLSTVLVLALRAFHCRPRRKKRARCTARVTSRMVDASRFSCGGQDRHRRLLCPRCQRPPRRCAAEQRDELATFHSITSSARASRLGGIVSPSALAVFRLMNRSNLLGWTTGKSAGTAPLRTRPT